MNNPQLPLWLNRIQTWSQCKCHSVCCVCFALTSLWNNCLFHSSQDCELQRLEEAKRCRAELQRVHAELEKTEEQSTSEEPESEVKELRQQLLQAYNELKTAENTEYKTQHQLKWWALCAHTPPGCGSKNMQSLQLLMPKIKFWDTHSTTTTKTFNREYFL